MTYKAFVDLFREKYDGAEVIARILANRLGSPGPISDIDFEYSWITFLSDGVPYRFPSKWLDQKTTFLVKTVAQLSEPELDNFTL